MVFAARLGIMASSRASPRDNRRGRTAARRRPRPPTAQRMETDSMSAVNEWDRAYNLNEARKHPSKRAEAAHQREALKKLLAWYESAPAPDAGGLLVLPTGAGKTFTAVRFLCRNPLSDGYKVLWL